MLPDGIRYRYHYYAKSVCGVAGQLKGTHLWQSLYPLKYAVDETKGISYRIDALLMKVSSHANVKGL